MKYAFTNIAGSFILNTNLDIIDEVLFSTPEKFAQRELLAKTLTKKYPDVKPLPTEKIPAALQHFRNSKYVPLFYANNLILTKQSVKRAVNEDMLITHTIANITEVDKVANILSKRLREWYSLTLPELEAKITDHYLFAELIVSKTRAELLKELKLVDQNSMGAALDKKHLEEMILLAKQIRQLYALRQQHELYLEKVMSQYCPNLLALAGVTIGAKLLELGKGLKHLALLPASTIQLLGAEKALFRHIRSGSRSPKHGFIINHPLVQKAKEKGRAARKLADKLSLCARLDYFKGEFKADEFKRELEERLQGK